METNRKKLVKEWIFVNDTKLYYLQNTASTALAYARPGMAY